MKQISNRDIIHLNSANYAGLKDKELQLAVRKHSTIELLTPTSLENIELELSEFRKSNQSQYITIFFFGKDINANGEIHFQCAQTPHELHSSPDLIAPNSELIENWYKLISETLQVERIGFSIGGTNQELSFVVTAKETEVSDENGFLEMHR